MNKNKRFVLSIVIFIGLLFLITPDDAFAQYSHSKAKNTCNKHETEWDTACGTKYGIKITATDYSRNTTRTGSQLINTVGDRTIKISANAGAVYRIRIIYGDIDSIDKLSASSLSDLDDEVDSDDGLSMKKATMKNGSYSWTLHAGKEALVLVSLAGQYKTDDGEKENYEWDSGETCITGTAPNTKKHKVYCKAGNAEIDGTDVELKGVAASLYVENPNNSGLVTNIRSATTAGINPYNKACINAKKGVYANKKDEKDTTNNEYTIKPENVIAWTDLYNKVLADYCEAPSFAYNLKRSQIRKISNKLLEVFYYQNRYNTISDNYTEVENKINQLKEEIESEKITQGDNSKRIFSGTESPEVSSTCDKSSTEIGSKQYLYTTSTKTIETKKLSDGKKYKVCRVKCYEHLKIIYDPPVASIAGLCFTYKVTVQSETECGIEKIRDYEKALLNKKACSPVPICSNDENHTQAGPSEDFDNCIKVCDDGKYSQNCINKCYKEVYGNKSKKSNPTSSNKSRTKNTSSSLEKKATASISNLAQINSKYKMMKLASSEYEESDLIDYYKEDNNSKCKTSNIIGYFNNNNKAMIDECAEYFFYAKSLYPCGKYNDDGTKWLKFTNACDITDAGATEKGTTNIPMQIGRSSPFYLRSEESTKDLLKSLVGYTGSDGKYRKYNINSNGIKRQYSERYICNESCTYTGCSKGDALSAADYTDKTAEDLEEIKSKLADCTATAACDTTTTTSNFDIKIINPRKADAGNEVEKTGTTDLKNTSPTSENKTCPDEGDNPEQPDPDDVFSMFVPADEDINSKYGILGLCYDNTTAKPQYKTTITFPGSWINYKARKIEYDMKDCKSGWALKGSYFCSAYDSSHVNEKWWQWRTEAKDKDGNLIYPTFEEPTIKNNIQASAKNFGKYNWNINYSCFYGIYNGEGCPPDNPCCDGSTCLQNYKFQVINAGKFFTEDTNQKQGYNWTSKATIKTGINTSDSKAVTYTINPQKYLEYVHKNENNEAIYDTKADDYYIYLSSDGIKYIKNTYKNRPYADYVEEDFKEDKNIVGLVRYTSSILRNLNGYGNRDIVFTVGSNVEGTNNNYNDLSSLLGTD